MQVGRLDALAGLFFDAPLPLSPPQHQVYDAEPLAYPCSRRHQNNNDMIAGMAPPHCTFHGNTERPQGWLLLLTHYFSISGIRNERQQVAYVGLWMEGYTLDWWNANKDKYASCAEVLTEIVLCYVDLYCGGRANLEIHGLRQTRTIHDNLHEIDQLNTYANIPDRAIMNKIIDKLSGPLRCSMAHYEHLHENSDEWSKKPVRMDIITTEFPCWHKQPCLYHIQYRGKKHTFEDRMQLKGGSEYNQKKSSDKRDFVQQAQMDSRLKARRCFKCGRDKHQASACEYGWVHRTHHESTSVTATKCLSMIILEQTQDTFSSSS